MTDVQMKSICILGRQPELGLAELESIYGAEHLSPTQGAVLLDVEAGDINFKRLGGTVKVARILNILPNRSWPAAQKYLLEKVPEHLRYVPDGKFTLGLSAYNLDVSAADVGKTALTIKKSAGRSMRVVPNVKADLSSAQVLHNKLTHKGAWELLLVGSGKQTILAQTMFVQDIEAYGARDQARPHRDSRVGMLPPKLAQILINLAAPPAKGVVLDPFCGTGVILQEALLMGHETIGTDIEPKMVQYTKKNLAWLKEQYPSLSGNALVSEADATNHKWPPFDALATESYLGRPLGALPAPAKLNQIIQDVNTIAKKFLTNLRPQLKTGCRAAIALPAWQMATDRFQHLPLIDGLSDMGYSVLKFKHVGPQGLIYYRPGQLVARHIIVIKKAN